MLHTRYAGWRLASLLGAGTHKGFSEATLALADLGKAIATPKRQTAGEEADEIMAAVREVGALTREVALIAMVHGKRRRGNSQRVSSTISVRTEIVTNS